MEVARIPDGVVDGALESSVNATRPGRTDFNQMVFRVNFRMADITGQS